MTFFRGVSFRRDDVLSIFVRFLKGGAQGPCNGHAEENVGRTDELPVRGSDLLEVRSGFCEEPAAELVGESALDTADSVELASA